jgi:hypothetical protein
VLGVLAVVGVQRDLEALQQLGHGRGVDHQAAARSMISIR